MIDHYNAFISYKHAPEDIKVAETVQKELEHFHIPSKIRKITGMKRIEKIFRDKNELPITSNLTETISYALEHSDYLIVICSTRTKESVWVQREIEYFLRNHSKRQILTVLVNGEPQDVIPEILQYEDHRIQDSTGRVQYVRTPIEPLSCDYRMSFRKATKIELPRLASALIGCSYDELMNRRRQYAIRRTAIAFSVLMLAAVAFSIYMIHSRNKIRASYIESLRSQSKYLAKESQSLFFNEERITALQLALEALPKDENDERPVTPEAVKALTDASLSYVNYTGVNIAAAWNYNTTNGVNKFKLSPDGSYLAALDNSGSIHIWETKTHKKCVQLPATLKSPLDICFFGPDELGIIEFNSVYSYDIAGSSLNWKYDIPETQSFYSDPLIEIRDDSAYLFISSGIVKQISLKDGTEEASIEIVPQTDDIFSFPGISDLTISPNGKKIAFIYSSGWEDAVLSIYDIPTGKTLSSEPTGDYLKSVFWADDSHLMYALTKDIYNSSFSVSSYSVLSDDHIELICANPSDLKTIWSTDFVCNDTMINCEFVKMPKSSEIAYYNGNISEIYDTKTGKRLFRHNLNSPIVGMYFNSRKNPYYITHDGGLGTPYMNNESDTIAKLDCFSEDIAEACITSDGYYICTVNSDEITFYGTREYDKDWKEIDSSITIDFSADAFMNDHVLAISTGVHTENPTLTVFNLDNYKDVLQFPIEQNDSSYTEIIYADKEYFYTLIADTETISLSKTQLSTGKSSDTKLYDFGSFNCSDYNISENGVLCFVSKTDKVSTLNIYDIRTDTKSSFKIDCEESAHFVEEPAYYEEIHRALICDYDNNLYIINTSDGSTTKVKLPSTWDGLEQSAERATELGMLVSDGDEIMLVKADGTVSYSISCSSKPCCYELFSFDEKQDPQILVLYSNGDLSRYNAKNGQFIGMSSIDLKDQGPARFDFDADADLLYILGQSYISLVDTEYWIETTSISNIYGYDSDNDRFLTYNTADDSSSYRIGYFEHYSLEDLIEKAEKYLQGSTLSKEKKSEYGITSDTTGDD